MFHKLRTISTLSSTSAHDGDNGVVKTPATDEIRDDMNEGSTRTYRISDGVSNQAIELAGLAAVRWICVKTDQTVALRINGTESITIDKPADFTFGFLSATTSGVTSLDLSNASGSTATVQVQLGGDPT